MKSGGAVVQRTGKGGPRARAGTRVRPRCSTTPRRCGDSLSRPAPAFRLQVRRHGCSDTRATDVAPGGGDRRGTRTSGAPFKPGTRCSDFSTVSGGQVAQHGADEGGRAAREPGRGPGEKAPEAERCRGRGRAPDPPGVCYPRLALPRMAYLRSTAIQSMPRISQLPGERIARLSISSLY